MIHTTGPGEPKYRSFRVLRALPFLILFVVVPLTAAGLPLPGQAFDNSLQQGEPPQGELVEAIRVEGNQSYPDETIHFYLATRVGAPFDWATVRQDFRVLLNTGFFDDLEMRWERSPDGVVLIIRVIERPMLRSVRISGTEKIEAVDFLERMEELEFPFEMDKPLDRQALRRGKEVLTMMLQGEEGLQFVRVDMELIPAAGGAGVDAFYSVVEGDEVRIEQVYFEGATVFTQRELRWSMKRTSEHWFMSFLTKNDRFSWAGFEQDMLGLFNLYRKNGYLDFNYAEPEIEVYEVERPWFFDKTQRLFVTIPIQEGRQYRIGQFHIEGNTQFTEEQLLSLMPLESGDVADVEQIVAARDAIDTIYKNFGYLEVFTAPQPSPDPETGIVDITYVINENDIYYVNRIDFEGNANTRDFVLRRSLRLSEKERWSQARFDQSLFKIYQLGYFDDIEPELSSSPPPAPPTEATGDLAENGDAEAVGDSQDQKQVQEGERQTNEYVDETAGYGQVDVKIKLVEVGRNQISFGGGVSALEGGFITFGYTTRNLFGRGQTVSFFGQFGGRRTNARISYFEPYLFNRALRFGFDLFRDSIDYFDFQREGTGISTRIGFPLDRGEFQSLFFEYSYEFIDIGLTSGFLPGLRSPLFRELLFTRGTTTTSSVRPYYVYNSIDNPFNPSRGKRLLGSFEMAGGILGGTLDFWKTTANVTWYKPTVQVGRGVGAEIKQIFAVHLEFRRAGAYGNLDDVPIFERFFLGGSNSVRGTRLRSIGPVDRFGNIIGGTKSLQYNLEYIFQVASPLRLAIFHDAGQAWAPEDGFDLTDLRKTVGVEFKIFMPVFNVPFRFFWAYNFDPRVEFGEERSTFEFAIGSTF